MKRFFIDPPDEVDEALLTGGELHHLRNVLRARPGEHVILFDGAGMEYDAEIVELGKQSATLRILCRRLLPRMPELSITLAAPLPKGERQRWLIEKIVELGVARFIPLITTHGVAKPTEEALQRLGRYGIEACKQCRRNQILEITAATAWNALVAMPRKDEPAYFAHPAEAAPSAAVALGPLSTTWPIWLALGPEGGLTSEEARLAEDHGWKPVHLGARILRVETAAEYLVVAASVLAQAPERGD